MKYITIPLAFLIFTLSCKQSKIKRITYDGEIAEGMILLGKDTIFNGDIKFYDSTGATLQRIVTYKNDIADGPGIYYYPNGKMSTSTNYSQGKENGFVFFYDTSGSLFQKTYYFYDVCFGPIVTYKNRYPIRYTFYSFDGFLLFSIDYDSIKNKKVSEWQSRLIFLNSSYITSDPETKDVENNYFIYLISPPEYPFRYTLCQVDSANNLIAEVKRFGTSKIWDTFQITKKEGAPKKIYAIKLEVYHDNNIIHTEIKKVE
jgi:antitoxin component YwqK of YwqJK toxin-antitoxin module